MRALKTELPTAPCSQVIARWRREEPEFDLMMRHAIRMGRRTPARAALRLTEARMGAIEEHIMQGGSLASYARLPGAPSAKTLYRWVQRHAEFGLRVDRACAAREDWYFDAIADAQMDALKTARSMKEVRRASAELSRREMRLRRRPGRGTWAKWLKGRVE